MKVGMRHPASLSGRGYWLPLINMQVLDLVPRLPPATPLQPHPAPRGPRVTLVGTAGWPGVRMQQGPPLSPTTPAPFHTLYLMRYLVASNYFSIHSTHKHHVRTVGQALFKPLSVQWKTEQSVFPRSLYCSRRTKVLKMLNNTRISSATLQ